MQKGKEVRVMKKVAFFISSYFDGIGVNTLRLADEFAKNNYSVDLLTSKDEVPIIKSNISQRINCYGFKQKSVYKRLPELIRYIKKERPDVIISGGETPNLILILSRFFLFKRQRPKAITSIRTHLSTQLGFRKKNFRENILVFMGKVLYKYSDQIVTVSNGVASDVSKLFKIDINKIKVIYNPIINDEIFEKGNEKINHSWLTHGNHLVILGVGRLVRQKNFPLLIDAFSILRQKVNAKLIIIGEGKEKENLHKKINFMQLSEDIHLTGYLDNPYPYMKLSDVFVLSSDWEGFANVIVEAMAFNTNIVSTKCPSGPSEILKNGEFGYLVDPGDKNNLAEAILKSLVKKRNNENNIQRAKYFSAENCFIQYEELLR